MKLSPVWVRIFIVAFGVGLGPLVQLIATPWLARIYSPADFGQMALFTSVVSILTVVSCLRYEGAIQVVDDLTVDSIVWASLLVVMLTLTISMFCIHLNVIQNSFESLYLLAKDVTWVPLVAASIGITAVASNLTMRTNRYFRNAFFRSGASVFFVIITLSSSKLSLVHANVIAFSSIGMLSFYFLIKTVKNKNYGVTLKVALKYFKYPVLLAPTSLLDTIALTLPVLFISGSYGVESTGHYTQIQRLIGAPVLLAGVVAGQLFTKRSGELYRAGGASQYLLWKVVGALAIGGASVLATIAWYGESICLLILGDAWRFDTKFLLLTSLPLIVRAIVSPITTVFLTHNKIGIAVIWQVTYFSVTFIGLKFAASAMSFERFLLAYCLIEVVAYFMYLVMAHFVAGTRSESPTKAS